MVHLQYDPSISSAEYLRWARKHRRELGALAWWFDYDLDSPDADCLGVLTSHVEALLDPQTWASHIREGNKKPRIYIHGWFNQRHNLVVRWANWPGGIFFPEDFDPYFLGEALREPHGSNRPFGEIMWEPQVHECFLNVRLHSCPVSTAMVYSYKAKLAEVVALLSQHINVVGATTMTFRYDSDRLANIEMEPTISRAEQLALLRQCR